MKNKKTYCLTMSQDLKEKIEETAKKKNITVSALIRLAISEYIERNN